MVSRRQARDMARVAAGTRLCKVIVALWYISKTGGASLIVSNVVCEHMQRLKESCGRRRGWTAPCAVRILRGGGLRSEASSSENPRAQMNEVHEGDVRSRPSADPAQCDDARAALLIYTMQPIDVGERFLTVSNRAGRLCNADGLPLPGTVVGEVGSEFLSFQTNGDGGCGLHAACGFPNAARELKFPGGQRAIRERFRDCLSSSYSTLKASCVFFASI